MTVQGAVGKNAAKVVRKQTAALLAENVLLPGVIKQAAKIAL